MQLLRRAEFVSGVGVGLLTLLGIVGAFFLPVGSYDVAQLSHGQFVGHQQQNVYFLQQVGSTAKAIAILATLAVLALMVMVAALQHVLHRLPIDLLALWGVTILLLGSVILTHSSTSYLFQPSALIAIICALVATIYQIAARRLPK